MSKIKKEDEDFKEYEIPIVELFLNVHGGKDYKIIKETLETLLSRTITILEDNKNFTYFMD